MRSSAQEAVPLKNTWFVNWTHWSDIKIMYIPKKKKERKKRGHLYSSNEHSQNKFGSYMYSLQKL